MIQFFKDSVREIKHVVWPTRKETSIYFSLVVVLLVCFGLYLFLFSTLFSEFVFSLKNMISSPVETPITNIPDVSLWDVQVEDGTVNITPDAPIVEATPAESVPVEKVAE